MEEIFGQDACKKKLKDERDLDAFLSKVDEVDSILKGLASHDESAVYKADDYIKKHNLTSGDDQTKNKKIEVNRTVINSSSNSNHGFVDPNTAGFMAAMEKDCQERAERRRLQEAEATALKEKGNKAFGEGNFKHAIKHYSKALEEVKYWTILYTNRAQAYIKVDNCQAAIDDCKKALWLEENCLKAFIIQGKAYLGMKQYDQAVQCYQQALEMHPDKEAMIKDYIAQANLQKQTEEQESSAAHAFSSGDSASVSLVQVMDKCCAVGHVALYYIGGVNCIKNMLNTVSDRVLFRTHGGLQWSQSHSFISKCFFSDNDLTADENLMCSGYLGLLHAACIECEKNQYDILEQKEVMIRLLYFIESSTRREPAVSAIALLELLSKTDRMRHMLITNCDVTRLVAAIFSNLCVYGSLAVSGLGLLNMLAAEKKFKLYGFEQYEGTILSNFESFLADVKNPSLASLSFAFLLSCCTEKSIRLQVAPRVSLWTACHLLLCQFKDKTSDQHHCDVMCTALNFLASLTLEPIQQSLFPIAVKLSTICCHLMNVACDVTVKERSGLLLNRLLAADTCVVTNALNLQIVPSLLKLVMENVENTNLTNLCIVGLTACTMNNEEARRQLVKYPKGLGCVVKLLQHANETIVGNAALCVSHCVMTVTSASKALAKTDIIRDLLVLARDQNKPAVQHNCAILIAKLASSDERHLCRLRELHGLEILHTVLQHVPKSMS